MIPGLFRPWEPARVGPACEARASSCSALPRLSGKQVRFRATFRGVDPIVASRSQYDLFATKEGMRILARTSRRFHLTIRAYPAAILLSTFAIPSWAQVNSWTKPTSGSWEELQWSYGVLPGDGQ